MRHPRTSIPMPIPINEKQVKSLVGKEVYVMTRQGQVYNGILYKFNRNKLYLHSKGKGKPVGTSAFFSPFFNPIAPLALFDLLAISEAPFFFNPFVI